jgi:TonB family protein
MNAKALTALICSWSIIHLSCNSNLGSHFNNNSKLINQLTHPPEFPGGIDSLYHYLSCETKYPELESDNDIMGRVLVQFMIDENGEVQNPEIIRSVSPGIDREALRIVTNMPRWKPGFFYNTPTRVYYIQPIVFKTYYTHPDTIRKEVVDSMY